MGLFDKIKSGVDTAQNAANDARSKVEQTKAKAHEVRRVIDPTKDGRPYAPMEVLQHEQHDCIKVYGTQYNQDAIKKLEGDTATVAILNDKIPDWNSYPVVNAADGSILGAVYDEQLEKSGLKKGYTALVEIHRPIYYGQQNIELYLPKTKEALDRENFRDSLKFWSNLDSSKWQCQHGERFDMNNVDVLTSNYEGKKPEIIVIGNGVKLFTANSRMKIYKELSARLQYKPRRLIVEMKNGENGPFYHVGFYY